MMAYVDGFCVPVPHDRKEAYREMAAKSAPIFRDAGVERIVECWGDDLPQGKETDFFRAVKAQDGENVVFSWMVWPSKEARNAGWAAFMADERTQALPDMPFDGKRLFWGGFMPLFDSDDVLA